MKTQFHKSVSTTLSLVRCFFVVVRNMITLSKLKVLLCLLIIMIFRRFRKIFDTTIEMNLFNRDTAVKITATPLQAQTDILH